MPKNSRISLAFGVLSRDNCFVQPPITGDFNLIIGFSSDLTDFMYQRDWEVIAFARPDLAVSGTGSSSVARAVYN